MVEVVRDLQIRPAAAGDLPALTAALDQERFFTDRIERQRAGRGVLLVAWLGEAPVGDVYVWMERAEEPEIRTRLPDAALLNHLEVRSGQRNRGIGTRLVRTAEGLLHGHGYRRAALGVAPDNDDAARLYRRLGYLPWPYPDVETSKEVQLADGSWGRVAEKFRVLVKDLTRPDQPL
jgi:ribosomal protein S18 acetylase RimI-like enzyme